MKGKALNTVDMNRPTLPRVCIVTPVLNGEQYLDETIASVLGQAGDFILRYHIQDGGSTDDTLGIVRRWRWRHRLSLLPQSCSATIFTSSSGSDRGMYDAINRGFATALPVGSDVAMGWIAADDQLATGALATVTRLMSQHPDIRLLGGRASLIDERGSITGVATPSLFSRPAMAAGAYDGRSGGFVLQEGTFWSSGLWHEVGGLDPTFRLAGDWDLWRRFAAYAPYVSVDSVLGFHRRRPGQLSEAFGAYHREVDDALDRLGPRARERYWQAAEDLNHRQGGWAKFRSGQHAADCFRYDLPSRQWERMQTFGAPLAPTRLLAPVLGYRLPIIPTEGFGPFNAADAAHGLHGEARWMDGERATGRVSVPRSGRYRIVLRCRCFLGEQRLAIAMDDRQIALVDLEHFGHERENELALAVVLTAGRHVFSLTSNRPRGSDPYLLVTAWTVEESGPEDDNANPPGATRDLLPGPSEQQPGAGWPRISIVVPTLNQGHFIDATLRSLARQGYPNLELIVVDGGSTDETMYVLREFLPLISTLIHEPDNGQSDAINKGFAGASGTIMSWLNSDDLLADGALFAVAQAFMTGGTDLVVGVCEVFGEDTRVVHQHLPCLLGERLPLADLLDLKNHWLRGGFFYQPEVFFSHDIWQRAGGRVDESLFYSMDYDLWVRMAATDASVQVIGHPVARFRMHAAQKTSSLAAYLPELSEHARRLRAQKGWGDMPPETPARPRLRIVFFNDYGYRYGAGIAHRRLVQATAMLGHDVVVIAYADFDRGRPIDGPSAREVAATIVGEQPDLVFVGNLHSIGADFDLLGELAEFGTPIIFYAHDEWVMTGRCAYRGDCRKNRELCDAGCPTALAYPALPPDRISDAYLTKRVALARLDRRGRAVVLTNSRQMAGLITSEIETGIPPVRPVQFGIDTTVYAPGSRWRARALLDIPQDAFVVMTAAASVDDDRKGLPLLLEALASLGAPERLLLIVAGYGGRLPEDLPFAVRRTGYVEDESVMALFHRAADVFAGPSRQEAFGQTFLEAAACGIPTVAFPVGGVKEVVVDQVTGLTAPSLDPPGLASAIERLRDAPDLRRLLGAQAAIHARNRFSLEASAARLQAVFAHDARLSLQALPSASMTAQPAPPPVVRYLAGASDHASPGRSEWTPLAGIERDSDDAAHDRGLARGWRVNRHASLLVCAVSDGLATVTLAGHHPFDEQTLHWAINGGEFRTTRLVLTPESHPDRIELVAELEKGPNRLDLRFEPVADAPGEQPWEFAFVVESISATPLPPDADPNRIA